MKEPMHRISPALGLIAACGLLLLPGDALAWGPVAHLDFALQILAGAATVAPAVLALLERRRDDFLYGSLAADAVVGKSLSRQHLHCHNWTVARALLAAAREQGEAREAFMLGYLGHLGADVVAHNHIVPQMLIAHFRAKGIGHIYWESRSDEKLLKERDGLAETLTELSRRRFSEHDRFLARHLVPPMFSHALSTGLFHRGLGLQRRDMFRRAISRIEGRSKLSFTRREVLRWRALAVEGTRLAIERPDGERLGGLDPTGRAALTLAARHRRELRRHLRRHGEGPALDELFQRAYRETQIVDISFFEER